MTTFNQPTTINAMDLRKEPGTYLDRVDYRDERFIVERAGKPKAVLVPIREFEQMERRKRDANERFWEMTQELRARVAHYDPSEVQAAIDEAVEAVRHGKAT